MAPKARLPADLAAAPVNVAGPVGWALTDPVASTVLFAAGIELIGAKDGE